MGVFRDSKYIAFVQNTRITKTNNKTEKKDKINSMDLEVGARYYKK